jgi:hypothetical protein
MWSNDRTVQRLAFSVRRLAFPHLSSLDLGGLSSQRSIVPVLATPVTRERDPTARPAPRTPNAERRTLSELLHRVARPLQLRDNPVVANEVAGSNDN